MIGGWKKRWEEKQRARRRNANLSGELEHLEAFRRDYDAERERRLTAPETVRARLLSFEVLGRCSSASFSPDERELAVSSGFTNPNNSPDGAVSIFSTSTGAPVRSWPFRAHYAQATHAGSGQYVHVWHENGRPGELIWWDASGRQALGEAMPLIRLVASPSGCAGLTLNGELVVAQGLTIQSREPSQMQCIACEPETGLLAMGGHGLVVTEPDGRMVAQATRATAEQVTFLSPDLLVTTHGPRVHLWRRQAQQLELVTETIGPPDVRNLIGIPKHGVVLASSRVQERTAMFRVTPNSLRMATPPMAVHGGNLWASRSGSLLAVVTPAETWLPPVPELVEIFHLDSLLWGLGH